MNNSKWYSNPYSYQLLTGVSIPLVFTIRYLISITLEMLEEVHTILFFIQKFWPNENLVGKKFGHGVSYSNFVCRKKILV